MIFVKQRLKEVAESGLAVSNSIKELAQAAFEEIERLEKLPPNRKRIKLKSGHEWYVWDDGYRWYVQPTPNNPNVNMREPTCVFEYKHNDQPAGFMEFVFESLKGEDS